MFPIGIGMLLVAIALGFLIAASYCDIFKKSEIPDEISVTFVAVALLVRVAWALWTWDSWFFLEGLSAGAILFAFGYVLYRLRQWGGADLILIAGIGVTLGWAIPQDLTRIFSPLLPSGFLPAWSSFLLNMMIVGSIYGVGWIVALGIASQKLRRAFIEGVMEGWIGIIVCTALLSILAYVLELPIVRSGIIGAVMWLLYIFAQRVEASLFVRSISVRKLRLEDWLVEDIKVNGKVIASASNPGITEKEFERIKKAVSLRKLRGRVKIKEGIPFVPVFPATLLITIIVGDVLFGLVTLMAGINYGIVG